MKRYSEVIGLPVFCHATGNKLADVFDIVVLRENMRIFAFTVGNKFISSGNTAIQFQEVSGIGNDAVMVNDKSVVVKLNDDILSHRIQLIGMNVYTQEGKNIGTIKDVLFDIQTGNIEGAEISESLFDDIVTGRNIVTFGSNMTLNDENIFIAQESYDDMLHDGGGLKARFGLGNKQYTKLNN